MNRSIMIAIVSIVLLAGAAFGIYFINAPSHNEEVTNPAVVKSKVVDIDDVAAHPDRFTGYTGVSGSVTAVATDYFTLGCADACIALPVAFAGQMPQTGSEVVVWGKVTKNAEGQYIFDGQEVQTQ